MDLATWPVSFLLGIKTVVHCGSGMGVVAHPYAGPGQPEAAPVLVVCILAQIVAYKHGPRW